MGEGENERPLSPKPRAARRNVVSYSLCTWNPFQTRFNHEIGDVLLDCGRTVAVRPYRSTTGILTKPGLDHEREEENVNEDGGKSTIPGRAWSG